jgi:hypothetical protein
MSPISVFCYRIRRWIAALLCGCDWCRRGYYCWPVLSGQPFARIRRHNPYD